MAGASWCMMMYDDVQPGVTARVSAGQVRVDMRVVSAKQGIIEVIITDVDGYGHVLEMGDDTAAATLGVDDLPVLKEMVAQLEVIARDAHKRAKAKEAK